MFLSCEAHSYKYDNGTGAEIERKLTPLCEQTNLDAAPLMCHTSCCGGHLLTTLSTHPPSSLKDKSPRFERLDRSGPLVTDQSSSIRRLRLRFTYLCSHCIFFFLSPMTVTYIWPSSSVALMILRCVSSFRFHGHT